MRHPRIPIARPAIGEEEVAAAARVLRSGWVMQGPEVEAFEGEFAAYLGAAHACAVTSGTAALHLALLAVGVKAGDEVLTASHSFIATANSIRLCGAEPRFVDIDPQTLNLDVRLVEAAITARTTAILGVHQLGMPCDLEALSDIASRRGLTLVEDAACAAGSEIRWRDRWQRIGRPHGALACFSFHPRKLITTGEGGMITTTNAALDARVRALRQHIGVAGMTPLNYRLTDLQAAVGRVQLTRLPRLLAERRSLVDAYRVRLPAFGFPREPEWARSNWQSLCVRAPAGVDVRALIERLRGEGLGVGAAIANAHQQQAYSGNWSLPVSERAASECLMLPLPSDLGVAGVEEVAHALLGALGA